MAMRLTLICYLIGLILLTNDSLAAAEESARPNILFVFADDQTYESIHALGNDEIETPNLDRLVRSGTTLTRAYNQGGFHGAVCVASSAMLVSGRYLWHAQQLEQTIRQPEEMDRLCPWRFQSFSGSEAESVAKYTRSHKS
jgi:choline-sulfatase